MLDFVARVFRGWMNVLLWLILIGLAIAGFIAGGTIFGYWGEFSGGHAFLGLLIGGLVGLVVVVLSGGLIANFLNMVDNIELLTQNSYKTGNSSGSSSSGRNTTNATLSNAPPINRNYGDSWTCKKCNEKNPITSTQCKGCGEYK